MATKQDLLEQALQLPVEDRLEMYHILLDSLDEDAAIDPAAWDIAWAEEIWRRRDAVKAGTSRLIPGTQAFREARDSLAREPQS